MKKFLAVLLLVVLGMTMLAPLAVADDDDRLSRRHSWHDRDWSHHRRPIGIVSPDGTYIARRFGPNPRFINNDYGWGAPAAEAAPTYGRASNGKVTWSTEYLYQVVVNEKNIDFRVMGDKNTKSVIHVGFETNSNGNQTMLLQDTRDNLNPTLSYTEDALNYLKLINVDTVILIAKNGTETTFTMAELESGI